MKKTAVIFDFDNTVIHMPTKIKLVHGETKEYLHLSTAEFAHKKEFIGKPGILEKYSFDERSFEEFRSHKGKSFLINDLLGLLHQDKDHWKAYYFNYFLEMLSTPEDSENVYILSARDHEVEEFYSALDLLRLHLKTKHGICIYLPKKEHLFFVGGMKNIALAKSSVIESIIRKESIENTEEIEFADDDLDNVKKAHSLFEDLKGGFSHLTFTLSHVLESSVKKIFIKK